MKLDGGLYFDFQKVVDTIREETFNINEIDVLMGILSNKRMKLVSTHSTVVREWLKTSPKIHGELARDVYCDFYMWCLNNKVVAPNKISFARQLCKDLLISSTTVSLNGKSVRIYK